MTLLIALILIMTAAPPITVFACWYGLTAPWWRSPSGRALFTSSLATALLVDLSLLYRFIGSEVPDVLALVVYALVAAGCWLMFGALAHDRWQRRKAD